MDSPYQPENSSSISASQIAEVAVDIWKISERAKSDDAAERVGVACERAQDRLRRLGFELDTLVGQAYSTNMRARVVDHEPTLGPMRVAQCISPAVYFAGVLVREAEVVTTGGDEGNEQDS